MFRRPAHETVKIGADNPDNHYQSAAVSGEHEYRIWGTRGTVHYLGIGTYVGSYGSGGRMGQSGYLEAADMRVEPDGSFEILVSCEEKPGGNWLPMEPDTSLLIVRQTFQDRKAETIADLHIERLGGDGPQPVTPEAIDRGLAAAAAYVAGTANLFADWAEGFAKRPNELPHLRSRRGGRGPRRPEHLLLPRLLGARARRGPRHRGHAARMRLLELPAQQPLDGVARLPLPPDRRQPLRRAHARTTARCG